MDQYVWPDINLIRVHAERSARWSWCTDVEPVFSRSPDRAWCFLFRDLCEEVLPDWKEAGFLRICGENAAETAEERLREVTRLTNSRFRDFLARASLIQPTQVRELIALEGSLAISDNGQGTLCNWR